MCNIFSWSIRTEEFESTYKFFLNFCLHCRWPFCHEADVKAGVAMLFGVCPSLLSICQQSCGWTSKYTWLCVDYHLIILIYVPWVLNYFRHCWKPLQSILLLNMLSLLKYLYFKSIIDLTLANAIILGYLSCRAKRNIR